MKNQVLVIGGRGHVGRRVVEDLLTHTSADVTITGRTFEPDSSFQTYPQERIRYLELDLADRDRLNQAIASTHLVVHCAGPFRYRDGEALKSCIRHGVHYIDVSDDREFTKTALICRDAAKDAGITAVINAGVFPGMSNSLARQGVEQLDTPEEIYLSYAVSGSGGAGAAVMQTTFLTIQHPFPVWVNGQWQSVKPYTGRKAIAFPPPFGQIGVYWFDMPESFTLVDSFPVQTVEVKFGSVPDFYNHLTWMVANWFPPGLIQRPLLVQGLSRISAAMTRVTDQFSGTGVAVQAEVRGVKDGKPAIAHATLTHTDAATATGQGAGMIAEYILAEELNQPGVWSVEQVLPTPLFERGVRSRNIQVTHKTASSKP